MMRKEQGTAFISIARKWVEKSYGVELSYDIKDDDATENYKFGFNNAVKSRKQVENAYNYYKEHHTAEQEGYLKKKISEFFSCLCYDRQIKDNFSQYSSIFYEQLLIELPKISLSGFKEDKGNPHYTVIEYVLNIIFDRYFFKALSSEKQEEYELPTDLSDETRRYHQLIALKAFEFAVNQGWNDSYAFYSDRQLECILDYVNENIPKKAVIKKIKTLKEIMINYQMNKLHSLEGILDALGEEALPAQNDDIQKIKEVMDELVCYVNNEIASQKMADKFTIQWVWKYFHGYSAMFEDMKEYPYNFCAMIRYEYSILSNEYPIFNMIYVDTFVEFVKEHKALPTREQYIPLSWKKIYPDEECPKSITNSVNNTYSEIVKSESFKKAFGSIK